MSSRYRSWKFIVNVLGEHKTQYVHASTLNMAAFKAKKQAGLVKPKWDMHNIVSYEVLENLE